MQQTASSFIKSFYNQSDIDILIEALSKPSKETIIRVNTINANIEECIKHLEDNLPLNFEIKPHYAIPNVISIVSKKENQEEKMIIYSDKWIIVHGDCYQSLKRGADLYFPGILAMSKNIIKGDLISIYISNEKILNGQILKPSSDHLLWISNGIFQLDNREEWIKRQNGEKESSSHGLAVKTLNNYHPSLNNILNDKMFCQNLPSILTVESLLPIEEGMWVLDMCAAPGGKTTHLGQYTRKGINLIALDKNKSKVMKLRDTMNRMGVVHGKCLVMDAVKYDGDGKLFDRILLDAPCSALGQRPMLIDDLMINTSDIDGLIKHQESLFYQAVKLLKPGGIMVYSTCTINPQENEYLTLRMCNKFNNIIEPIEPSNVAIKSPSSIDSRMQSFLPHSQLDTIGFFYVKLFKKSFPFS